MIDYERGLPSRFGFVLAFFLVATTEIRSPATAQRASAITHDQAMDG